MCWRINELITIKIINAVKRKKNTQTIGTKSEHKRYKIEHCSMLNEQISQKTRSLSVVNKFSDLQ